MGSGGLPPKPITEGVPQFTSVQENLSRNLFVF